MSNVLAQHRARTFRVAGTALHSAESPYRDDRVAWAHDCILWKPGEGPTTYQDAILAALDEHHRVAVVGPHGIGKTCLDALAVLHFATTRDVELDDWKNPTTASAWRQLTHFLWPEIHKWARRLNWPKIGRAPFNRAELLKQNLKLRTGEAFAIASDNPSSIEGAHADSLFYLLDECKTITGDTFDAIEGAFSGAGAQGIEAFALANSTPGEPLGRFYDIHARRPGFEDWHTIHVTLDDAIAAGRISPDWAKQRAKQWGVDSALYRRRVLGEFAADDEDSVIPLAWVERANERWLDLHDDDNGKWLPGALPHITNVGVDVARSGTDLTVVAPRHRNVIDRLVLYRKASTMKTAGAVATYLKAGVYATVDVIGIGAGVVDRLRELDLGVIPFHASERSDRRDSARLLEFINRRSAAWWHLRELLDPDSGEDIALPPDDELLGELVAPKWFESSNGRIQVEKKDEVRKRLGRSTDKADAVVMAFWPERPVGAIGAPIDEHRKRGRNRERSVDDLNF